MLARALDQTIRRGDPVTDDAEAMERAGHSPRLVVGHPDNFKITRPGDLERADLVLASREPLAAGVGGR